MKSIEITIDDARHRLLYVEYKGNEPIAAITEELGPHWMLNEWIFFYDCNDRSRPMFSCVCYGGDIADGIAAPQFTVGRKKFQYKIWKADELAFRGVPENCVVLEEPLSKNPFRNRCESIGFEVCEACGMYIDDDSWSHEFPCGHGYWDDDEDEIKYY